MTQKKKAPPRKAARFIVKKAPKVQIPLAIKRSLHKALDEMAQMNGRNRTNFIELLILNEAKKENIEVDESLDIAE